MCVCVCVQGVWLCVRSQNTVCSVISGSTCLIGVGWLALTCSGMKTSRVQFWKKRETTGTEFSHINKEENSRRHTPVCRTVKEETLGTRRGEYCRMWNNPGGDSYTAVRPMGLGFQCGISGSGMFKMLLCFSASHYICVTLVSPHARIYNSSPNASYCCVWQHAFIRTWYTEQSSFFR